MKTDMTIADPERGYLASLLVPGVNCTSRVEADRAAVLVDGAAYFANLKAALQSARRSIFIVGWDFDARIQLPPQHDDLPLGDLLRHCVEAQPELHVHVLVWSVAIVHGPSAVLPNLFGADWENHPRIHFKLDSHHPLYASHHQKIVCIDGVLAFVGGIDLTVRRWDDRTHRANNESRIDEDGKAYPPVHDMQMLVDEVADTLAKVGSLAAAVDRLNIRRRGLKAFPALTDGGPSGLIPGYWLLDPVRPFNLPRWLRGWAQALPFRRAR